MNKSIIKKTIKNIEELINAITLTESEAGKLMVSPDVEGVIARILELEKIIQEAKERIAEKILDEAQKKLPNFAGFRGDLLKIYKRSNFKITDEEKAKGFIKEVVKVYKNVDKEELEKYVKETGELPEGIEKEEKLVISLK